MSASHETPLPYKAMKPTRQNERNRTSDISQPAWHIRIKGWIQRRWWRCQYRRAHKHAFNIATMGFHNGNAQTFLNAAKDNLYRAAREFDLMADNWHG